MKIGCFYVCFQDEQNKAPLSNLLEIVNTVRSFGNRSFKQSHYDNAKDHYKKVALHCVTVQPVFFFHVKCLYDVNGLCIYVYIA